MTTINSSEVLIRRAQDGLLSKADMADFLAPDPRWSFLEKCAQVEREFTKSCAAEGDYCLESGCALQGEACLNALLKAGPEYHKACARLWLPIFGDPQNRIE
jgi:hypothetical protein